MNDLKEEQRHQVASFMSKWTLEEKDLQGDEEQEEEHLEDELEDSEPEEDEEEENSEEDATYTPKEGRKRTSSCSPRTPQKDSTSSSKTSKVCDIEECLLVSEVPSSVLTFCSVRALKRVLCRLFL